MTDKEEHKKDYKFNFKITASKRLKCSFCSKSLYGEEGFIDLKMDKNYYDCYSVNKLICSACFQEFIEEFENYKNDKAWRKERFKFLQRKNMLRKL